LQQQFLNLIRGTPGQLPPPVETMDWQWAPHEKAYIERTMKFSAIGAPETVRASLEALIAEAQPDEIMATAQIYDHAARLRSFELLAEIRNSVLAR
jgi:alkanesulfonate monooxygenase SsuD/methylene tetrahydromethanopterin reductase-like flavin-dependent oxidoreductase (luciferase family)